MEILFLLATAALCAGTLLLAWWFGGTLVLGCALIAWGLLLGTLFIAVAVGVTKKLREETERRQ